MICWITDYLFWSIVCFVIVISQEIVLGEVCIRGLTTIRTRSYDRSSLWIVGCLNCQWNHFVNCSNSFSNYWFPLCCRYDILVGRSPTMGNATRLSFQSHISLVDDLKPGEYMMKKMSSDYYVQHLLGFTVWVCCSYLLWMALTTK